MGDTRALLVCPARSSAEILTQPRIRRPPKGLLHAPGALLKLSCSSLSCAWPAAPRLQANKHVCARGDTPHAHVAGANSFYAAALSCRAADLPLFRKAEASNSSGLRSTTFSVSVNKQLQYTRSCLIWQLSSWQAMLIRPGGNIPLLPCAAVLCPCPPCMQLVDLHKLETPSLKRYRRAFQLAEVDAAAPKADLVTAVQRHFTTQVRLAGLRSIMEKEEKEDTDRQSTTARVQGCHRTNQQTTLGCVHCEASHRHLPDAGATCLGVHVHAGAAQSCVHVGAQTVVLVLLHPQEVDEDEVLCELVISLRRRYKQQQQRQRLLAQQYSSDQQDCYYYSQQQAQYSDDDSAADQQLRQLILLQQQYVYLGPGLFQGQQQQE